MKSILNRHHILLAALLLFTGYVFFERCLLHVNCRDEVVYQYVWERDDPVYLWHQGHRFERHVGSFTDILHSQIKHYRQVNGRAWVHTVEQAFTGHMTPFCTLNTLVFLYALWLIVRLASGRWLCGSVPLWLCAVLCMLYLFPMAESLWTSVNMGLNYLWPASLGLTGMVVWERISGGGCRAVWCCPLLAVLGLTIGWSHEAIGAPMAGALALMFVLRRGRVPRQLLWFALPLCAGACAVVFAPGNFFRLSYTPVGFDYFIQRSFNDEGDITLSGIILLAAACTASFVVYRCRRAILSFVAANRQLSAVFALCLLSATLVFNNFHVLTFALLFGYIIGLRAMWLRGWFRPSRPLAVATAAVGVLFVAHGCLVLRDNRRNYDMQTAIMQRIRQAAPGDTVAIPYPPICRLSEPYTVVWKVHTYSVMTLPLAAGRPGCNLFFVDPETGQTQFVDWP